MHDHERSLFKSFFIAYYTASPHETVHRVYMFSRVVAGPDRPHRGGQGAEGGEGRNKHNRAGGGVPFYTGRVLERIGSISDGVESSMTVDEVVGRAYLCGVSDTLEEFRRLIAGWDDAGMDASAAAPVALRTIGDLAARDGRIAAMLAHPADGLTRSGVMPGEGDRP